MYNSKQKVLLVFLTISSLIFLSCSKQARMYPVNDIASQTGVLKAKYIDSGSGGGKISLTMPDGEILKGEYTTVDQSVVGFGSIYKSVYVSGDALGTGSTPAVSISGSHSGMVAMFGNRGTMMQCEYYVGGWAGNGKGACKSSSGAIYRLHF